MSARRMRTYVSLDGYARGGRAAKVIQGGSRTLMMQMGLSRADRHGTPFDRWYNETHYVNCKPSWELLPAVAEALGSKVPAGGPRRIMEQVSQRCDAYRGVSYKAMGLEGMPLPASVQLEAA